MAIYRMIREAVFEPDAIERMTAAYEHALKVLQLTDRTDPLTELVARKIIEIAWCRQASLRQYAIRRVTPCLRMLARSIRGPGSCRFIQPRAKSHPRWRSSAR